ncbi:MAG TPA: ABC-type transport auxiliary lipoprotein family protein [bacterium]|nr:ABC-type transport auxiliary lipoprotein family protein [bacterium]HPN33447.1 ABC-type transport auxiliary lipoprotein family protein [bacterium]
MKKIVWLCAALVLVACGHVPQTRYYLIAVQDPHPGSLKKELVLRLSSVTADAVHAQDRLIFRASGYEVQFDPYRRWALAPTEMIQQSAMDFFAKAGVFKRVTASLPDPQERFWSLSIAVRAFEEIVTPERRIGRVSLQAWVSEGMHDLPIWEGQLTAEETIQGADAESIIRALSLAAGKTLQQLLAQLEKQ